MLRDGQIRRAPALSPAPPRALPTGFKGLDAALGGGLARLGEKDGGALLLLVRGPQAGTFGAATIELERGRAQWEGRPGAPGRFLRGAHAVGAVARHKRMPPSAPLPFTLPLEPK